MGWNHQTDVIRSSFFCNWWGSDGNLMLWDMGTGLCCRYLPVSTAVLCLAVDAQTEWFRMVYRCWSRLALEPFKALVNQNGICGQRCRPMWQKEIGDLRKSSGLAGKSCFEWPFRLFLEAPLKLHHFGDIWGTFWKCGSSSNVQGILILGCSLRHLYSLFVSTPLHICLHACKCPPFVAITPACVAGSGILIVVFAFAKWISQGHIARQDAPSPYQIQWICLQGDGSMTSSSRQSLPKVAKVEFDWKMKIALSTSAAFGCSFGEATLSG